MSISITLNLKWEILKSLSLVDLDFFSYADVLERFPNTDKHYLSRVLSEMVERGMLVKLVRDLYTIVPTNADSKNYIPDWHLVAKHLMKPKKYYIGYYSAMQIHGLITQPSLTEIIVTQTQVKPSIMRIQGVEFQFVTHTASRFFGVKNTWINKHDKVMASDLEKTIVDAVTKPHLSGGIVEIAKAIYETRDKISLETLIKYLIQNDSNSAIKRYLFICDLIGIEWTANHESMLQKIGNSYSLLDTSAPDEGVKNSRFGLKINIDTDTIKNSIYT